MENGVFHGTNTGPLLGNGPRFPILLEKAHFTSVGKCASLLESIRAGTSAGGHRFGAGMRPTFSFVLAKDKVNCPKGKRGAPGGKRAAPGTKENRFASSFSPTGANGFGLIQLR